jgi:hypothetical protein
MKRAAVARPGRLDATEPPFIRTYDYHDYQPLVSFVQHLPAMEGACFRWSRGEDSRTGLAGKLPAKPLLPPLTKLDLGISDAEPTNYDQG